MLKILGLLISAYADLVNIDDVSSLTIKAGSTISVSVSSNPSSGMIWVIVPEEGNNLAISDPYGEFIDDDPSQVVKISCKKCKKGDYTYVLLALKKPWKNSASVIRKILIEVN